jgi:hypothetical protein
MDPTHGWRSIAPRLEAVEQRLKIVLQIGRILRRRLAIYT